MMIRPLAAWPEAPTWDMGPPADPTVIVRLVRDGGTGTEVGAALGITRERVRQIWKRETGTPLPTRARYRKRKQARREAARPCSRCGGSYPLNGKGAHAREVRHVAVALWSKVDRNGPIPEFQPSLGPCWLWTGSIAPTGYGHVHLGNDGYAHRLSYRLAKGPIPKGLTIDHLCRVTACVNPTHLEAVTHKENVRRGKNGVLRHLRQAGSNTPHTHCLRGHELTDDNRTPGSRACRKCCAIRSAASYARKRAA